MWDCNYFTEQKFTKNELVKLEGLERGSMIGWRNDFHVITSLHPLTVHAIWDMPRNA